MSHMLLFVSELFAAETCLAFAAAESPAVIEDIPSVESSGVARSHTDPDTFYTHGDNGDPASLFVFGADGSYRGEQLVRNVSNTDWEDLANGPCLDEDGDCLWIADIGDNDQDRESITIHIVPESLDGAVDAVTCSLVYPEAKAHNAETLLVWPDGSFRIVTKAGDGEATVFRGESARCGEAPQVLVEETHLEFDAEVTGGAVSEDGETVIIRTYTAAWMWQGCTLDWSQAPTEVDLGSEPQGESVSFTDDGGLITTSEGVPLRARRLPCEASGELKCAPCGCGGDAGAFLFLPLFGWMRRQPRRQNRAR